MEPNDKMAKHEDYAQPFRSEGDIEKEEDELLGYAQSIDSSSAATSSTLDAASSHEKALNTQKDSNSELQNVKISIAELQREKISFFQNAARPVPPPGLTGAELIQWRREYAKNAKSQLLELEQRIQKLQIMSRKLLPNLPSMINNSPSGVNLGNVSAQEDSKFEEDPRAEIRRDTKPTEYSEIDAAYAEENSNAAVSGLAPGALSEIRQMLHEEIAMAISSERPHSAQADGSEFAGHYVPDKALRSLHPRKSQEHAAEEGEQERSISPATRASWKAESDGNQLSKYFREVLLAQSGADDAAAGGIRYEEVVHPRNLQEAVPRSLPLLCGGFSRMSPVRIKCFEIYISPVWNTFFALTSVANAFVIAIAPEYTGGVQTHVQNPYEQETSRLNSGVERLVGFSGLQAFDYACVGLLGIEIAAGCIAVGLVSARSTWLRCSDLHKVELIVLFSAAGEFVGAYFGFRSLSLRPLLLVRVLKPILRFGTFVGVRVMLAALYQARLLSERNIFCVCNVVKVQQRSQVVNRFCNL